MDETTQGFNTKRKLRKNEKKLQGILNPRRTRTLSQKERKFIAIYLKAKKTMPLSPEMRSKLWLLGSGAETLLKDNPGYYHKLLERVHGYPNP